MPNIYELFDRLEDLYREGERIRTKSLLSNYDLSNYDLSNYDRDFLTSYEDNKTQLMAQIKSYLSNKTSSKLVDEALKNDFPAYVSHLKYKSYLKEDPIHPDKFWGENFTHEEDKLKKLGEKLLFPIYQSKKNLFDKKASNQKSWTQILKEVYNVQGKFSNPWYTFLNGLTGLPPQYKKDNQNKIWIWIFASLSVFLKLPLSLTFKIVELILRGIENLFNLGSSYFNSPWIHRPLRGLGHVFGVICSCYRFLTSFNPLQSFREGKSKNSRAVQLFGEKAGSMIGGIGAAILSGIGIFGILLTPLIILPLFKAISLTTLLMDKIMLGFGILCAESSFMIAVSHYQNQTPDTSERLKFNKFNGISETSSSETYNQFKKRTSTSKVSRALQKSTETTFAHNQRGFKKVQEQPPHPSQFVNTLWEIEDKSSIRKSTHYKTSPIIPKR